MVTHWDCARQQGVRIPWPTAFVWGRVLKMRGRTSRPLVIFCGACTYESTLSTHCTTISYISMPAFFGSPNPAGNRRNVTFFISTYDLQDLTRFDL